VAPLTDTQLRATAVPVTANAGTNLNTSALALESGGNLAAIAASASVIDDWDESDRAKVNPIVGQAGVQGASGTVSANTQRVVLATDVGLPAGESFLGTTGVVVANPSANFTRPSDTAAYAVGDLIANSTTAGSVAAMSLTVARVSAGSFSVRKCRLHKSTTSITNASFRVHFFRAQPSTITNGDNGAFSVSGVADYLGSMNINMNQAFTDGACGFGEPSSGNEISALLASGTTIVALLEARGAYTPGDAEVFTLTLEEFRN
jgi:hypothetical protein